MKKGITEKELMVPALELIAEESQGLTTTTLIMLLREKVKPQGDDIKKLKGRNDDSFSQKVRNLISHKTIFKYADLVDEKLVINDEGLDFLLEEKNKQNDAYSPYLEGNDDFREENYMHDSNFKIFEPDNIYLSVSDLKRKFDRAGSGNLENALILSPYYQRYDGIWSKKDKSLFIESIILNIPIPSIYLSEDNKGNLIVIDGRQRLSTLFEFMDEKKSFKLQGLSILKELNGYDFSDLIGDKEKYKTKIEDRSLHISKLRYGTDETFIIETFERVNTKGVKLNAQEIRNAIHHGKSTELLNEISDLYSGDKKIIDKKRMKDKYLILRYFAMKHYYDCLYYNKQIRFRSISDFLSQTMVMINSLDDTTIKSMRDNFVKTYDRAKHIFKNSAFKFSPTHPINMILFEMTLIIVNLLENKEDEEIKIAYDKYIHWNETENKNKETTFEQNIKYHRDSKENIEQRLYFIKNLLGMQDDKAD